MHADAFDRFHEAESRLHHLDPRVKVVIAVLFILSNALLPDGAWAAFGLSWIVLLWANHLSSLGVDFTFKRSFVALPFALAAISAIFSPLGQPLAEWTLGSLKLIPNRCRLDQIWQHPVALVAFCPGCHLAGSHHPLPRHDPRLRAPARSGMLTTIVSFLYRYLFVLTDEVMRLLRARQSRSATVAGYRSGRNVLWRARVTGNMAGQLFLRSYERSDRIYNAMLARGYTGQLRTLNPHVMKSSDWLFAALSIIIILFLQLIGRF